MQLNVIDQYQHYSPQQIQQLYNEIATNVAVGCLNLSGEINIGMMIRTASLFAVGHFYIFGRKHYDRRSSVGTQNHIPIERISTMKGASNEYLDENTAYSEIEKLQETYTIIFIEQSSKSISLQTLSVLKLQKPPLFIFGSESEGIPASLLNMPNTYSVEIKQLGIGRSFNVSTACGIVLYEWFRDIKA